MSASSPTPAQPSSEQSRLEQSSSTPASSEQSRAEKYPAGASASSGDQPLAVSIKKLGIDNIQRHLFLCATPLNPKCCDPAAGLETWTYLKKRLKELKLDSPQPENPGVIFRTKADCLRVCQQGPILLIYPDGIWYRNVTPAVMEQIIQGHILENRPVQSHIFHPNAIEGSNEKLEPNHPNS